MLKLAVLCLALTLTIVYADEDEYQRDIRQSPVFFQNGPPPRGAQPQKGQPPFPGTLVPKFIGFGGAPPQGFRPAPQVVDEEEEEEIEKNSIAPSPSTPPQQQFLHFRQSQASPQQVIQFRPTSPLPPQQPIASAQILQPQQAILKGRPNQQDFQIRRPQNIKNQLGPQALSEEDLEEKEEPDRLTELLPQSKFSCNGKKTGYYADDGLNCEVFHYCQDNAKHSWICPEGFSFHQVHLICMPPSSDNICQQSSQFHFVNDFLYRPINAEEAQSRPNVTIRYADRYYPENYYEGPQEQEGGENVRSFQQRQPPPQYQQPKPVARPTQPQFQATLRPLAQLPQHFTRQPINNQAFHSPEEVNIPLQSRRPTPAGAQRGTHPPPQQQNFDFENRK